ELGHDVAVDLALVEVELVAEPRAAARLHRDTQLEVVATLLREQRAHLGRRAVGQDDPLRGLLLNSHLSSRLVHGPPARPWRCSNVQSNDMRCRRIPATAVAWLTTTGKPGTAPLHTGGAPHREPPGQVLLPFQVAADDAPDVQLERVVPALAGQRGERVERAPLVQVDEGEAALLVVPE